MNKEQYNIIEQYMHISMEDSAHDKEHIYRVLYVALDIAKCENNIDYDVIIASCLLHDIGRREQFENPELCHAAIGGEKAYQYLVGIGWEEKMALDVKNCICTHRFRKNNQPQSIETKILFDADKIDVSGTLGIARTLFYKGQISEPLYTLDNEGAVLDGKNDIAPSFFQEYKYKIEKLYGNFYTKRGNEIAQERQASAVDFYNSMLKEVQDSYEFGKKFLDDEVK